jgi:hypothetical protein
MAVGGSFGFFFGLLIGLAFPEYEAKKFERKIKIGSTLLAVHTDSTQEVKVAENVLKKTAAFGIHHIEETGRCKPKTACKDDKNMSKKPLTILLLLAAGTFASSARADEVTPVSPSEKKEEQKATMPPDVTTPGTADSASSEGQRNSIAKTKHQAKKRKDTAKSGPAGEGLR